LQLDNQLYQLLYKNNCVILPGFGGFISNAKSAEIHAAQGYIKQPHKSFSFNKNLITNDGLVYNFIAQKLDITYNKAEEICREFIQNIIYKLYQGESVVFFNIGKLYLDVEKNIQFFPSQNENFALSAFGLKDIALHPIHYLQKVEEPAIIDAAISEEETATILHLEQETIVVSDLSDIEEEVQQIEQAKLNSGVKFKFRQLAATIMLMSAFAAGFIFLINQPSASHFAQQSSIIETARSLFFKQAPVQTTEKNMPAEEKNIPVPSQVAVAPEIESAPENISTATNNGTVQEMPATNEGVNQSANLINASVNTAPAIDKKASAVTATEDAKKIESIPAKTAIPAAQQGNGVSLVFGSFKSEANATTLLHKLKKQGINAEIISNENGFKRVILRTDNNQAEMIKSTHPGSWIL
jgi:cell division septation protein DedD